MARVPLLSVLSYEQLLTVQPGSVDNNLLSKLSLLLGT